MAKRQKRTKGRERNKNERKRGSREVWKREKERENKKVEKIDLGCKLFKINKR